MKIGLALKSILSFEMFSTLLLMLKHIYCEMFKLLE